MRGKLGPSSFSHLVHWFPKEKTKRKRFENAAVEKKGGRARGNKDVCAKQKRRRRRRCRPVGPEKTKLKKRGTPLVSPPFFSRKKKGERGCKKNIQSGRWLEGSNTKAAVAPEFPTGLCIYAKISTFFAKRPMKMAKGDKKTRIFPVLRDFPNLFWIGSVRKRRTVQ